jgi:hypothetical protein
LGAIYPSSFPTFLRVLGGILGPTGGEHGIVLVSPGLDPGAEHVSRAAEGVAVVVPAGADARRALRERADLVSRALALHGNALSIDRDHAAGGEGAAADGDAPADIELLGHAR